MSNALRNFEVNYQEVASLLEAYDIVKASSGQKSGRFKLDHLTKSALVILCSAWEVYVEEVTEECMATILSQCNSFKDDRLKHLHASLRDKAEAIFAEKKQGVLSERAMEMIEKSWDENVSDFLNESLAKFNTPKSADITKLFKQFLGLPTGKIPWVEGHCWDYQFDKEIKKGPYINDMVSRRGSIAHASGAAISLHKAEIDEYCEVVKRQVLKIDLWLYNAMKEKYQKVGWRAEKQKFKELTTNRSSLPRFKDRIKRHKGEK